MRTTTLIAAIAGATTLVLLAVPKKGSRGTGPAPSTLVPKVSAAAPAAAAPSARLEAQLDRRTTLTWGRDPFAKIEAQKPDAAPADPPAVPAAGQVEDPVEPDPFPTPPAIVTRTEPLPVLSGVSRSGLHRFAILDRRIVEEGDALSSGDVVVSIGHRTVTLRNGEEIFVIRLGDGR